VKAFFFRIFYCFLGRTMFFVRESVFFLKFLFLESTAAPRCINWARRCDFPTNLRTYLSPAAKGA